MENENKSYRQHRHHHGISLAFVLIAAGLIFLGFNTGMIPIAYKSIFISWQMLLIVLGVASVFKRHYWGGMALLLVGGFFIVPEINKVNPNWLGPVPADFVHLYWPVLLIAAGAVVLLQWMFPSAHCCKKKEREFRHWHHSQEYVSSGYINSNNVFGSGEHIVLDPEFKGGEINSVFGGTKLDLRRTNLSEGTTRLELNIVFGGVTIYVPENWNVVVQIDFVLGGFEDKRYKIGEPIDPARTLLICGSCVFGGGELKN